MTMSRRRALVTGWKVGGGLLAGAATWTTIKALEPLAATREGGLVSVPGAEGLAEGEVRFVREGRFYLVRSKGELFAVSQTCPHLACRVPYCEASGRFQCPCHGSEFTLAGEWLNGPAPRGLDRYPVEVRDGVAVVDTRALVEGPKQGVLEHGRPSLGGTCGPDPKEG
jgi:cytochrome b6-f complex iron-sulfur subunit